MALNTLVKGLQSYEGITVNDLLRPGDKIGEIVLLHVFEEDCYSDIVGGSRGLVDIFSDVEAKTHFVIDDEYVSFDHMVKMNGEKKRYLENDEFEDIIQKMKKPAQFGDVQKQETRTDEKIRKGFDIPFNVEVNGLTLSLCKGSLKELKKIVQKELSHHNLEIVPYKMNIYEEGDFFVEHQDSPEENLLGTLVYVAVPGEVLHYSDRYPFHLNGKSIREKRSTLVFFQPEIPHEVKPVAGKRITYTFKVFSTEPVALGGKEISSIARKLNKQIKSGCGILLNSGYSHSVEDFVPKGKDAILIQALKELGYEYVLTPVILKNITRYKESYNHNGEKFSRFDPNSADVSDYLDNELGDKIVVYKVNEKMAKYLKAPELNYSVSDIFYIGLGYRVGMCGDYDLFIGNSYSGVLEASIYYNILLVLK